MSNIRHLLERYRASVAVKQLAKSLEEPKARVQLSGLMGAQAAFALAATVEASGKTNTHHLYIANSKEEAAYLQNDLEGILSDQTIHFFPDSFKRPAFFEDLNPTQVLQRSETVNKLTSPRSASPPQPPQKGGAVDSTGATYEPTGNGTQAVEGKAAPSTEHPTAPPFWGGWGGPGSRTEIVITYPEALFEKVVSPAVLQKTRIEVAKGEKLDVDFVIQVLVEYGFERTDFVYEPGQFSIRGGIIDLFSYGNELPYRIELFDDEVETIRVFEPLTQLSKQNIAQVSIVPNLNTRFKLEEKVSLFQVLPAGTVLWIKDFQFLLDRLQYCFEKAQSFAAKLTALDNAELREIFRDRAFLYPADVAEDVAGRPIVFLEGKVDLLRKNFPGLF